MDAGLIPEFPRKTQSATLALPWVWCGTAAVDGTVGDWAAAPLGSEYTRVTAGSVVLYIKTVVSSQTSDWHSVTTS